MPDAAALFAGRSGEQPPHIAARAKKNAAGGLCASFPRQGRRQEAGENENAREKSIA
jgi:hypothetical protein